jgi:hypothetical protein
MALALNTACLSSFQTKNANPVRHPLYRFSLLHALMLATVTHVILFLLIESTQP